RYQARVLDGLAIGPSPPWMQRRLRAVGQKPISNAVDAANYVMLELGQPLHVFDADRLQDGITVRRARAGETIACLDGRTRALDADMLTIADGRGPVAIAGIIGGADSAVSATTTRVVVEAANFLGTSVRATSRRLGVRTEASTRFEKQLHPEIVPVAAARLAELLQDVAGAGPVSPPVEVYIQRARVEPVRVAAGFFGATLGDEVPAEEVVDILHRLRFGVETDGDELVVTPPPFRLDVALPVDLVEEVGRVRGYNALPSTLPGRRLPLTRVLAAADPEWDGRELAMGAGFDEVITQSFAAAADPDMGVFPVERLRLANPMALDQQTLRTSLLPGLATVAARNLAWGVEGARVFELARVFWPAGGAELPTEARVLGFAIQLGSGARQVSAGAVRSALLELKGVVALVAERIAGMPVEFDQVPVEGLHPGRALVLRLDGQVAGCLGQVETGLAERLECGVTAVAEVNFEPIAARPRVPHPAAVSRFPEVVRDIAITVPELTPARDVVDEIAAVGEVILRSVELYDEYHGSQVGPGRKGLTVRLRFQAADRTLKGDEAAAAEARILSALASSIDARLRE
ncbi:MAG: phenylalanyl-tRNA synthetase beta chain, partial [Chloroflexota bacterium]|nr:phenylalanyl-tRNA synthetase beta chain [Chloroflexota bacterium]